MSGETPRRIRRQALGLRPGLQPYYRIDEQTPTRLVLQSRPGANSGAGRLFMGCGTLLAILSLVVLSSNYATAEDTTSLLAGLIAALPCGVVGTLGLIAGLAIGTTRNTITLDSEQGTIVYCQGNRLARRDRTQTLHFDQVVQLRFHPRPFRPPGPLRQTTTIVALEFVLDEEFVWFVDSAAERAALEPVATAMSDMLGLAVQDDALEEPEDVRTT